MSLVILTVTKKWAIAVGDKKVSSLTSDKPGLTTAYDSTKIFKIGSNACLTTTGFTLIDRESLGLGDSDESWGKELFIKRFSEQDLSGLSLRAIAGRFVSHIQRHLIPIDLAVQSDEKVREAIREAGVRHPAEVGADFLLGGYEDDHFSLSHISTISSGAAHVEHTDIVDDFKVKCTGITHDKILEETIDTKLRELIDPTQTSIEEAAQIVAGTIMTASHLFPVVGGDVNVAVMKPGESVKMFRAMKKNK